MVQIKVKGLIDGVHIYATYDKEQEFLVELEKRLRLFHAQEKAFEAFFHLPMLSYASLRALFQLCEETHILIKGLDEIKQPILQIKEGTLRSGQQLVLKQDTLWIGDIRKDSYVTTMGNLYVIGKVEGTIDVCYADCVVAASGFDAKVRICDSRFHNVTSSAPQKAYYNDRQVILSEGKGGTIWERSSQLHQVKAG